jgi:hypothetical protein
LSICWDNSKNGRLFQAFDNYVLKGADLDAELKQAERYTKAFLACLDRTQGTSEGEHDGQVRTCAIEVDPTLKSVLR